MRPGLLVGYFSNRNNAKKTLWMLERHGFFKTAVLSRDSAGHLRATDPFIIWKILILLFFALLFAGFTAIILFFFPGSWVETRDFLQPAMITIAALFGLLFGRVLARRSRFGVDADFLEKHSRTLLSEETVLLLQARVVKLHLSQSLILEFAEAHSETSPVIFIKHKPLETSDVSNSFDCKNRNISPQEKNRLNQIKSRIWDKHFASVKLLKQSQNDQKLIQDICSELIAASRVGQGTSGVAEWVIDNEYMVVKNVRDILLNLPRRFYRSLPALPENSACDCLLYIYCLARATVAKSEGHLTRDQLVQFIAADQKNRCLTTAELWALPQMLRIALIENIRILAIQTEIDLCESQQAAFWANRLMAANRKDINLLFSVLAELSITVPHPSPYFGTQLIDHLYDETGVLIPVQSWLERTSGRQLNELLLQERNREAGEELEIRKAFTSLQRLNHIDWKEIFEELSCIDHLLRQDPAGIYPRMDFETRDSYRGVIESFARRSSREERKIAKIALDMVEENHCDSGDRKDLSHIGYYLVGNGRADFSRRLGFKESIIYRATSWIKRHHSFFYISGVITVTGFLTALFCLWGLPGVGTPQRLIIALLAILPASQLAVNLVNHLITFSLPAEPLPKMDFRRSGVPEEFKTLVVIPTLLISRESIAEDLRKIETRYVANREQNLLFSIFTDYTDAPTQSTKQDQVLFEQAELGIKRLNELYGNNFFLFHRERSWCESQQNYIGWERKRGKLEQLNELLIKTTPELSGELLKVGNPDQLTGVRFVITLDSDTQLPNSAARRMVETLAHPLNQPQWDSSGSLLPGSYIIIQPRVSSSLASRNFSIFSRFFSESAGIDPYSRVVSDVYQDLSGEGSYQGKGIYDVHAFHQTLGGRFPEDLILSHDLLEGAYTRAGLSSDIELYDESPPDYLSYTERMHRWIRGDWQIAGWLLPRVPLHNNEWGSNPLSLFNRWKIFDNLRRSLVPISAILLLIASWMVCSVTALAAAVLILLYMSWAVISQIIDLFTTRNGLKKFSLSHLIRSASRTLAEITMLPHLALVSTGAVLRVLYRMLLSHRNLLEWRSSQHARDGVEARRRRLAASLVFISFLSILLAWIISWYSWQCLLFSAPFLFLWISSPLLGWIMTSHDKSARAVEKISAQDRAYLRGITRKTWRYFDDFVTEGTSWLPPDNYQVSHQDHIAMRTSPTNIGLWMLALLGARDCGYVSDGDVIEWLSKTISTLERLEKYEGHLLNWYDISSLEPLEPRYVSFVDSGNFLASLWALRAGLNEMTERPVFDASSFSGFVDCGTILLDLAREERLSSEELEKLELRIKVWQQPPAEPLAQILQILEDSASIPDVLEVINHSSSDISDVGYWCDALSAQITSAVTTIFSYLGWVVHLIKIEEADPGQARPVQTLLKQYLESFPSLSKIVNDDVFLAESDRQKLGRILPSSQIDSLMEAKEESRLAAVLLNERIQRLSGELDLLEKTINLDFLYDKERKLFSVGYKVSAGRLDDSYYDLLASEARLGSFASISRGEIPIEHWFSLARPHALIRGHRVLMSWSGSMFEYLMPLLLQHSYPGSLLYRAVHRAVAIQISHGRKHGVPWGMSESAYGNLDINKTYQYRAFGVPALGLIRQTKNQLVVAPYATMLAIDIRPKEAVKNLKWLDRLGLLNEFGFYESVDFSRKAQKGGEQGLIIKAYMAHHQGMGFIALINFLQGDLFRKRFHEDIRVRAFESLLQERIPTSPPLQLKSARETEPVRRDSGEFEDAGKRFLNPHTSVPKSRLLSNGSFNLMLTNAGGGHSKWNGQDLTRWRSDRTTDGWGSYIYLYEEDEDRIWSSAYHPVGLEAADYEAEFALDRVTFRRTDFGIRTETEIVVSPEDDVEIRRISLVNKSEKERTIDLTSYLELSMAEHRADRQHPAFNKLFIKTEALPEKQTLLAYRRSHTADPAGIFLAHRIVSEPSVQPFSFETDRSRFIGRGNTLARPAGAVTEPANSQGFVLDPVFSLRCRVTIAPYQRRELSFILAAAPTRDKVLDLASKYSEIYQIDHSFDFAWRKVQIELRLLHIHPEEARWFQQLANHLLFPNPLLRAPAQQVIDNHKGQAGLWPYGISGDLPILLVTVSESRGLSLVHQLLQAHKYLKAFGFDTDLLILNDEEGGYGQPLREKLIDLIRAYSSEPSDSRGSIILRGADQIPEDDLRLMKAVAGIDLVAARGGLAQQLGVSAESVDKGEFLKIDKMPEFPDQPLPDLKLSFHNGLGGFTEDGKEYVITLDSGKQTPLPWVNVMANPDFGTMVSESGSGFTWFGNSQRNRLTPWSNDPVLDPPFEIVYLRDENSGDLWTTTPGPINTASACRIRHGAGYTTFERNSYGVNQELIQFVPNDAKGGAPVKFHHLTLRNDSGRPRNLSATFYAELTLGEHREDAHMHTLTHWDRGSSTLMGYNRYHPEYPERVAFSTINPSPESYSGDRTFFLGRNRSTANPAAMARVELNNEAGALYDPCVALQTKFTLDPGEVMVVVCMLGQAGSKEEALKLVEQYRGVGMAREALAETTAWWDGLLGGINVKTPDAAADILINRWLLYQSLSCRIWGRSGFYQSGGAYGFRDQLQDVTAFMACRPELARKHILLAASRQFQEGDVQHWWHPPSGAGVRSRISDDLLWLPWVVAQYLRVTGDISLLSEEVPFISAPQLEKNEHESFLTPEQVHIQASIFEHCRLALSKGLTSGPDGLPLFGSGDWNDGMNLVGIEGRGESVWLGWFLIDVLQGMIELADALDMKTLVRSYQEQMEALRKSIEKTAWDGAWYLRGRFDDGTPLGSIQSEEAQIDSLPQSWAWLTGAADPQRAETALESAWNHLVLEKEKIVLLFSPPFENSHLSPGYIKAYPPGVRENGGQYTHGSLWFAMAMARKGEGSRAVRMLRMMSPVEHSSSLENAFHYGLEPYVVAADIYRLAGKVGKGGWSWYTGSAAWMYRAWVEEILGFNLRGSSLIVNPVIPASWPEFSIRFRSDSAEYNIVIKNPDRVEKGVASITLDGELIAGKRIPIEKEGKHSVEIVMGGPELAPE